MNIMERIEMIHKHPEMVGAVSFFHKLPENQGRNGPRLCHAYCLTHKTYIQGEGRTAEAAFENMWSQLVKIVPNIDGMVTQAPPEMVHQELPGLVTRDVDVEAFLPGMDLT